MTRRKTLAAILIALFLCGATPFAARWLIYRSCLARVERLRAGIAGLGALPPELAQARENLEVHADYQQHVLPRNYEKWHTWLFRTSRKLLTRAEEDLAGLKRGENPFADRRGTFLGAYRSEIDGGLEPYFLDVPLGYDASKPWPLVVQLHGLVGLGEPFQQVVPAHREDCLTLAPHGKGSSDFMGVAEQEVLQAIREVQQAYSVDPGRIYLQGHSMGATGAWGLAAHYPDRFAAISVSAGNTDHTVWEKLWEAPEAPEGSELAGFRKFLEDADSPISYAGNFLNLPVTCVHGEKDEIVPVEHSRNMVERLRALGSAVEYREVPLATHSSSLLTPVASQFDWLLARRKAPEPGKVRVKASRLRYGRSDWVEIRRFERLLEFGDVEAEMADDGLMTVKTGNVAKLALYAPSAKWPDTGLRVRVDGQELEIPTGSQQEAPVILCKSKRWWAVGTARQGLHKRAGLEGPIEDAMMSRFIVVYGTQGEDAVENTVLRREAEALRDQWAKRFGYPCLFKADTEVTEDDISHANLVCYGRPDQNLIVRRAADGLPIQFSGREIRFSGQSFTGDQAGVKFCYPNPLQPDRYLVVFAANSWPGMFQANNRFGNWFDWSAYENRNYFDYAIYDERTNSPETFLIFGYFDQYWRPSTLYKFLGSNDLRSRVRPWPTPKHMRPPEDAPECLLSDLLPVRVAQLLGAARFNASFEGRTLSIGVRNYTAGIGVKAPSTVEFDLGGKFRQFSALVGVDTEGKRLTDNHRRNNRLVFEVFGDGRLLASSGTLTCDSEPVRLTAQVLGVQRLSLRVRQVEGYRWFLLSAAWTEPKVTR